MVKFYFWGKKYPDRGFSYQDIFFYFFYCTNAYWKVGYPLSPLSLAPPVNFNL